MSLAPLSRLRKLRGLPPSQLLGMLRHKATKSQQSLRQEFRVRILHKIWPGAGRPQQLGLRPDIDFFGLGEWRGRKNELKQVLECVADFTPNDVVRAADNDWAHLFDLLGSGVMNLGEKIDWHRDFKSGVKWQAKYFKRIKEIELSDASDIKVPWELSRCYHFVRLGMAYWLTNDERYAREFVTQCQDWIEQNPPYHGVNWHCAMEVAIRAINWTWSYYFFKEARVCDARFQGLVSASLAMHGEFMWNNLEFDKRVLGGRCVRHNGNHYISDLVGLIYLGLVLPGSQAGKWLNWGLDELDREIQVQVLSDGVHWELSPSYHRLVLELVLPAVLLCSQNDVCVPQTLHQACEAMAGYMMHYLKPDGRCPLVRDADDGRVCILGTGDYCDHRHLLALAGVFFERADLVARAGGISSDVVWMLGPSGVERAKSLTGSLPQLSSTAFSDAGFYVFRDGDQVHAFVACADVGMKGTYGGHAHNDCLSFELFCAGNTFLTDCGTFIYSGDPAARNHFRSTSSHNTARIDGLEINRFCDTELFGMENDAKPKVLEWHTQPEFDRVRAEHYGYKRLQSPVVHRRTFLLDRVSKRLVLEDVFEGNGEHLFELFFHFFPGVKVEQLSQDTFQATASRATILLKFSGGAGWKASLEEGWVSERYGRKRRAWKIVLASRRTAPVGVTTSIHFSPGLVREDPGGDAKWEQCCASEGSAEFAT